MSEFMQERKPELTSEVMAFRDSLLSSTVSDTLDVWELKGNLSYFGLQCLLSYGNSNYSLTYVA